MCFGLKQGSPVRRHSKHSNPTIQFLRVCTQNWRHVKLDAQDTLAPKILAKGVGRRSREAASPLCGGKATSFMELVGFIQGLNAKPTEPKLVPNQTDIIEMIRHEIIDITGGLLASLHFLGAGLPTSPRRPTCEL